MQEYSNAVANSTHQLLLKTQGLQAYPTDMGRCVVKSPHLKARGVSTQAVSITQLAEVLR
jgi:hypothetical protein